MKNLHRWLSGAFISGGAIVVGIMVLVLATLFANMGQSDTTAAKPKPAATAAVVPAIAANCDKKFVQVAGNNASNRVDADFAVKYAKATAATHNMSKAQRTVLLENSANNGQRLAIWSNAFGLYDNPNNWKPLVRGNCLSAEGQALYYRFEGTLSAKGTTLSETQASAGALNSGINRGTYGVASTPGLSGNRKAVKVTLSDGSFVMILVRCGNVVFPSKPNLPAVPTDNRPPVTPKPTPKSTPMPTPVKVCPPNQPFGTWPVCKDAPSNDPAPRGNAPVGGGTNVDPGPGTYVPPASMTRPPAAPRVNPPPPVATTPPVGSTPDPAPAPAPEPSAPVPADPATGTSCAPGIPAC